VQLPVLTYFNQKRTIYL